MRRMRAYRQTPSCRADRWKLASALFAAALLALSLHIRAARFSLPMGRRQPRKLGSRWNYVLAVMFNQEPREGVMEFLNSLYKDHFVEVVFVGPPLDGGPAGRLHEERGLPYFACRDDCPKNVTSEFGYACAAQLIAARPSSAGAPVAAGYLWVHDDVAFRLSALEHLPPDEVWLLQPVFELDLAAVSALDWDAGRAEPDSALERLLRISPAASPAPPERYWFWWWQQSCLGVGVSASEGPRPIGLPALRAAWDALEPRVRAHWSGAVHGGRVRVVQVSDVFYVPAARAAAFVELSAHFHAHRVYMELAAPAILDYVGERLGGRPAPLRGAWLWDSARGNATVLAESMAAADFVHPLKCSQPESRALLEAFFRS